MDTQRSFIQTGWTIHTSDGHVLGTVADLTPDAIFVKGGDGRLHAVPKATIDVEDKGARLAILSSASDDLEVAASRSATAAGAPVEGDPSRDWRYVIGGVLLRLLNPLIRRMVRAGIPTGAPNVLLTIRGRRSGQPRTVPVGIVEFDGRRYVQSSYGEVGWAANLRAAGEATIIDGDRRERVRAVELKPEDGGAVLHDALEPFHRSRLLRALLGPRFRPPFGVLWRLGMRVDDTVEEYVADARRHPLFELRPPRSPEVPVAGGPGPTSAGPDRTTAARLLARRHEAWQDG